jgi:hypothetical protein
MLPNAQSLSPHDLRRVAVAAAVHPKTVARAYRGHVVRSTCAARIDEAARVLGLPLPPRTLRGVGDGPCLHLVTHRGGDDE